MPQAPGPAVLLQFGTDPFNSNFQDEDGRPAFTLSLANNDPNLVIRLTREKEWASAQQNILGPEKTYFYFGPGMIPGYVVYGANQARISMGVLCRCTSKGSSSRYFTAQSGQDYKWKITPGRMECYSNRTCLAVWEATSDPDTEHDAVLAIYDAGIRLCSEVMATLILNRMWMALNWPTVMAPR